MLQQNGTKELATSNTHTNVKETDKANYLTETEPIHNTPMHLTRIMDKWFITCGNTKLTEGTNTKEEQIEKLTTQMWEIILSLCIHVNRVMTATDKMAYKNNDKNL